MHKETFHELLPETFLYLILELKISQELKRDRVIQLTVQRKSHIFAYSRFFGKLSFQPLKKDTCFEDGNRVFLEN